MAFLVRRRERTMGVSASATASGLILSLTVLAWVSCVAFGFQNVPLTQNAAFVGRKLHQRQSSSSLNMVFDFFKQRSQEGIEQLSKLSDAAARGKLGEGLVEVANYQREVNAAMADGLAKSRNQFLYNLEGVLSGDGFGEDWLDGLEDALLQADLGPATANDVLSEVRSLRQDSTQLFTRDDLRSILRGKLVEALKANGADFSIRFATPCNNDSGDADDNNHNHDNHVPTVLFIMGANGQGKTTSIGKLAHRLKTEGNQTVLVAACDTFRAGAVAQLEQWADRAGVDCFGPTSDATSPSAVCYGALDKAIVEKYDTLLVDTSGRLSNNEPLTAELKKMKRVIQKRLSVTSTTNADNGKQVPDLNTNVPHETLLVLDAAQGRMALDSAKIWEEEIGLTGLILTKLDGSARGGSVVAVSRELGLPVKLIGVGEGMEDLRDFDPESFVDGLLGVGAGSTGGMLGKSGTTATAKSSSTKNVNEAKELDQRLKAMRKARDERAKELRVLNQPVATSLSSSSSAATSTGMTKQDLEAPVTPISTTNTNTPPARTMGGVGIGRKPNRKKKTKKGSSKKR